jgi:hypothetical protein
MSGAAYPWFRFWRDYLTDPNLRWAADVAGAPYATASICFVMALDHASKADPRGGVGDIKLEMIASTYATPIELIRAIFDAFKKVGLVTDCDRIADWERQQQDKKAPPKSASARRTKSPGAVRTQNWRQKKRAGAVADPPVTHDAPGDPPGDADETPPVTLNSTPDQTLGQDVKVAASDSDSDSDSDSEKKGFVRSDAGARDDDDGAAEGKVVSLKRVDTIDLEFAAWFASVENQVGREAAQFEYRRARLGGAAAGEIAEGWRRYAASKPPDRLWLNPENFLKTGRWRDRPAARSPPDTAAFPDGVTAMFGGAGNANRYVRDTSRGEPHRGLTYAERSAALRDG